MHGLRLAHQRGDRDPGPRGAPGGAGEARQRRSIARPTRSGAPPHHRGSSRGRAVRDRATAAQGRSARPRRRRRAARAPCRDVGDLRAPGRKAGSATGHAYRLQAGLAGAAGGERAVETPAIVVLPFETWATGPRATRSSTAWPTRSCATWRASTGSRCGRATRRSRSATRRAICGAIGKRLDAQFAVTGSALRSGDQLRVNAQLVDIVNDRPLWADSFDLTLRSAGDVFAVVDEIARSIVNELRLTLGTGQRRYDLDLDAYERYLEARTLVEPARRRSSPPRPSDSSSRSSPTIPPSPPLTPPLADAYSFCRCPRTRSSVTPARALELMRVAAVRAHRARSTAGRSACGNGRGPRA